MMLLCTIALFAAALLVVLNIVAVLLLRGGRDKKLPEPEIWPPVAVLIAARNEEDTLGRCLNTLALLDYPPEKLQVWIGNDASTDKTFAIAEAFCKGRPNWQVCDIRGQWGSARGKANVLAQLAARATPFADYFFITDADVAVEASWLKGMLAYFRKGVGIVNGTSVVEPIGREGEMQRYDWALALALAKAYTYLPGIGKTLTALGNNMAVKREAYQSVGGYESIPFSITEDYELHRQLEQKGYRSVHIASPEVKNHCLAVGGWQELLHQRKRWMNGAMELPLPMVGILFIQALFFPSILLGVFCFPGWGLAILLAKLLSQALLIRQMLGRLREEKGFPFVGYELHSLVLSLSLLVFYFLPIRVRWKGRSYG